MLDLKFRAELGDHSVIDIGTIIYNDSFQDTILTNNIMLDESGHNVLGNGSE